MKTARGGQRGNKFSTHKPTHKMQCLARLPRTLAVPAVTAEVASSSLVVPAIFFQALALISVKPSGVQKDTFWCPFCTLFRVRMIVSSRRSPHAACHGVSPSDVTFVFGRKHQRQH